MSNIIVLIGAGSIGQAIARRVSAAKHVLPVCHRLFLSSIGKLIAIRLRAHARAKLCAGGRA